MPVLKHYDIDPSKAVRHDTLASPHDIEVAMEAVKPQASKLAYSIAQAAHIHMEHHARGLFVLDDDDARGNTTSITSAQGSVDALFKVLIIAEAKRQDIKIDDWSQVPDAEGLVRVLFGK